MHTAFSSAWAEAWGAALNQSAAYREAAAKWEGSIAVVAATAGTRSGAVFLDVWHGSCRAARAATDADLAEAAYVLEAEPAAWKAVLGGSLSPMMALLSGKVKLARGELARLLPFAAAAKELVTLAGSIPTVFPADW